ncbi:MAG: c-type cytochrome domain-containing protein [Verrucomicrobiales bacterium]
MAKQIAGATPEVAVPLPPPRRAPRPECRSTICRGKDRGCRRDRRRGEQRADPIPPRYPAAAGENCLRCHSEKAKGGLRLNAPEAARQGGDSGEPALVAGQPDKSLMIALIESADEDERMPPKGDARG